MKLEFMPNDKHHSSLRNRLIYFGIPEKDFDQAWKTITMVWASKFNQRAYLAIKRLGLSLN